MGKGTAKTYLRFVVARTHPDSGVREGVFGAAYELLDGHDLAATERKALRAHLVWFTSNLATPDRFNRSTSKGSYLRNTRGISWLKSDADEHLARLREMVLILEEHGFHVTMQKSRRPGYIVYEDVHQIVAEPFADTEV